MAEGIVRREESGVIEIRLDRTSKKNALTAVMYREMTAILAEASSRSDVACVMIAANGDAFCAGNDIKDFLQPGGAKAAMDFIHAIAAFDKPLVAAVHGLAVGIGTTMLLHCDLVYAAPDARFITPFTGLGLVPEAASSMLLPARIGHAKAAAMLLLGEPLDAAMADATGLVTAIVPVDGLQEHARAKAAAFDRMPPEALAATRRLMRGDAAAITAQMKAEETLFAKAIISAEAVEAFTAFIEKRKPVFKRCA